MKIDIGIMRLLVALVWIIMLANFAGAQEYAVGSYTAFIGQQDLKNSRGARLTNAVDVIRQDRANYHRFGISQSGDQGDPWFFQPEARSAMAKMFASGGGIRSSDASRIVQGNARVVVTIYAVDGNFTSLRLDVLN